MPPSGDTDNQYQKMAWFLHMLSRETERLNQENSIKTGQMHKNLERSKCKEFYWQLV